MHFNDVFTKYFTNLSTKVETWLKKKNPISTNFIFTGFTALICFLHLRNLIYFFFNSFNLRVYQFGRYKLCLLLLFFSVYYRKFYILKPITKYQDVCITFPIKLWITFYINTQYVINELVIKLQITFCFKMCQQNLKSILTVNEIVLVTSKFVHFSFKSVVNGRFTFLLY